MAVFLVDAVRRLFAILLKDLAVPNDIAGLRVRADDLHGDNGLEHDRLRLFDRIEEGLSARGDERDFLGIDRVVLAVGNHHLDVLQAITRQRPLLQQLQHTLADGRLELSGNRPAEDVPAPLQRRLAAARQRLDFEVDLPELAGAAGLLLVAVVALRGNRNRLAVRNLRRLGGDIQFELPVHF